MKLTAQKEHNKEIWTPVVSQRTLGKWVSLDKMTIYTGTSAFVSSLYQAPPSTDIDDDTVCRSNLEIC